jgi:type IX secretion system PorP/SprF family membrane protein
MKNVTKLALAFATILGTTATQAQDVHFSQMFETPVLRNPAISGLFNGDVRIQMVHRTQWNTVASAFQTTSISGEFKKKIGNGDDFITIGGQILNDKAGEATLTTTQISPTINYHKAVSAERNSYLSLGFMAGVVQRRIDVNKMTTNNQFNGDRLDLSLGNGEATMVPSLTYFDGSVGMSYNSQLGENTENNFYVGVAYHHFNKAKKNSFYQSMDNPVIAKKVFSGGVRMGLSNRTTFTVQSDYSVQGSSKELVVGAMYTMQLDNNEIAKYRFHVGSYVRWGDAIIPVVKIETRNLSIATSYDANISQLKNYSRGNGGFEISLTYQKAKKDNSSMDAYRCPKF